MCLQSNEKEVSDTISHLEGIEMASFMSKRQIINTEKARVTQVISFSHLRNVYVDLSHSRSTACSAYKA